MIKGQTKKIHTLNTLRADPFLSEHYEIIDLLGQGSFGTVLKVRTRNDHQFLALKIAKNSSTSVRAALRNEIQILAKLQGVKGIPQIYRSGFWKEGCYLQMQLLEHNLSNKKTYTITQITQITLDLIDILAAIHGKNIIHQDLKPHNIMHSHDKKLYLVDFGLSELITKGRRNLQAKIFVGNSKFASVQAHMFQRLSKKDDLESLFYNIAFLYHKQLPWCAISSCKETKNETLKNLKLKQRGKLFDDMPVQFKQAFEYITHLQHLQKPDYAKIKQFFYRNPNTQRKSLSQKLNRAKDIISMLTKRNSHVSQSPLAAIVQTSKESKGNLLQLPLSMLGQKGDGASTNHSSRSNVSDSCGDMLNDEGQAGDMLNDEGQAGDMLNDEGQAGDMLNQQDILDYQDILNEEEIGQYLGENCEDDVVDLPLNDLSKFLQPLNFRNPFNN